jgi:cell division protease FtsH
VSVRYGAAIVAHADDQGELMEKKTQINTWYVVLAMFAIMLLQNLWVQWREVEILPYSQFQQLLNDGRIEEIVVTEDHITGILKEPLPDGRRQFSARRIEPDLARDLAAFDIKVTGATERTFLGQVLSWVMPAVVFFAIWMFVIRRFAEKQGLGGGLMSIGKSKAKVYVESDTKVTFADVAGVDEAKEELQETVAFLKDPKTYGRLGARIPNPDYS